MKNKYCPECGGDLKRTNYVKSPISNKKIHRSMKCEYCDYTESVPFRNEPDCGNSHVKLRPEQGQTLPYAFDVKQYKLKY